MCLNRKIDERSSRRLQHRQLQTTYPGAEVMSFTYQGIASPADHEWSKLGGAIKKVVEVCGTPHRLLRQQPVTFHERRIRRAASQPCIL
jgi:hypothetical protein